MQTHLHMQAMRCSACHQQSTFIAGMHTKLPERVESYLAFVLTAPGELIELRCDSVICPNPRVPDCYMQDGVCTDDQWCNLEDQVGNVD